MLLALLAACTHTEPAPRPQRAPRPGWVLLYYVPYDNDLGPMAPTVLEQIRAGTAGGGVEAAALVDLPGPGGVSLTMFADGVARPYPDPSLEETGDPATFRAFLDQAATLYDAEHYAVAVLDHGGGLMELARDDHPQPRWLDVRDVSAAVADFGAAEAGAVELLFLQVCAKGALSPLLATREAATVTLASQGLLGAPNDYYTPTLQALAAQPGLSGPALAAEIAQGSMFVSYTCVDNTALGGVAVAARGLVAAGAAPVAEGALADSRYHYGGEDYVDLGRLLDALGTPEAATMAAALRAAGCGHHVSPSPRAALLDGGPDPAHLSGVSVAVPAGRVLAIDGEVPGWSAFLDGVLSAPAP